MSSTDLRNGSLGAQRSGPDGDAWSPSVGGPYRWRWAAFAVVLLASVMDLLDSLATNLAEPTMSR